MSSKASAGRNGGHFSFTIDSYDDFVEASMPSKCKTFEEFCADWRTQKASSGVSAADYLTQGLNASSSALRYLPHKKDIIEAIRRKLSLLTFENDAEPIKELLKELETHGVRIFWPGRYVETVMDLQEKYNDYLENEASKEYFNRKNLRLYNQASTSERIFM
jgi:hypothetical protein